MGVREGATLSVSLKLAFQPFFLYGIFNLFDPTPISQRPNTSFIIPKTKVYVTRTGTFLSNAYLTMPNMLLVHRLDLATNHSVENVGENEMSVATPSFGKWRLSQKCGS